MCPHWRIGRLVRSFLEVHHRVLQFQPNTDIICQIRATTQTTNSDYNPIANDKQTPPSLTLLELLSTHTHFCTRKTDSSSTSIPFPFTDKTLFIDNLRTADILSAKQIQFNMQHHLTSNRSSSLTRCRLRCEGRSRGRRVQHWRPAKPHSMFHSSMRALMRKTK